MNYDLNMPLSDLVAKLLQGNVPGRTTILNF